MIKDCKMRHKNGNCLPAGGFCTANKNLCEALQNAYRMGQENLERKTGKWLYDKYYLVHVCSECDEQALEEYTVNPRTLDRDYDEVLSEYCPHCGSRMLEIEDEDEDEDEEEDE